MPTAQTMYLNASAKHQNTHFAERNRAMHLLLTWHLHTDELVAMENKKILGWAI